MTTETTAPKIFISYSWKPIQNKQKVIKLAERLTADGIHVILDDWDLKEGQDKYSFMEQMVNNPDVKRVLLICNKDYAEKANQKKGGVGIESLIVSDDIYSKADQTKFIPIVFEYDADQKPCVPTFVKTRIFVDLSNEDIFEDNYETLLRNIHEKPTSRRPPLGIIPSYIQTEQPIFLPTAHKVATIKNALINEKKNAPLLIQDYLDSFVSAVDTFAVKDTEIDVKNYIELITKKIDDLKVLRDDFVDFMNVYISNSVIIDHEKLHRFFEQLLEYLSDRGNEHYPTTTIGYLKDDCIRYFYYELFLTFTAILIEKEKFNDLAYVLQNPFIIENTRYRQVTELSFTEFRFYVSTLNEHKNKTLDLKRVSVTADTIKQRAEQIKFEKLIEADILLYYVSLLFPNKNSYSRFWFPETSCYRSSRPTILPRLVSERYFNKVKILFGVASKQELLDKVNVIIKDNQNSIQDHYYLVPSIKAGLRVDEIGTLK